MSLRGFKPGLEQYFLGTSALYLRRATKAIIKEWTPEESWRHHLSFFNVETALYSILGKVIPNTIAVLGAAEFLYGDDRLLLACIAGEGIRLVTDKIFIKSFRKEHNRWLNRTYGPVQELKREDYIPE